MYVRVFIARYTCVIHHICQWIIEYAKMKHTRFYDAQVNKNDLHNRTNFDFEYSCLYRLLFHHIVIVDKENWRY